MYQTDAAGNNSSVAHVGFSIDVTAPSLVLTAPAASEPTNISPIHIVATFNESVGDFDASDITVTNASTPVTNFSGSGTSYSFDVIPLAEGVVTITVAAGAYHDEVGNASSTTATISRTYATTSPSVVVTSPAADGSVVSTDSVDFGFDGTPSPSSGVVLDTVLTACSVDGVGSTTPCTSPYTYAGLLAGLNEGVHNFFVSVTDLAGNSSFAVRSFSVNTVRPVPTSASVVTDEDTATSSTLAYVDTFVPGPAAFATTSSPAHGALVLDSATGVFSYTPELNYNGSDSFTFSVNDGVLGSSADGTISISINPINDAPVLDAVPSQTVTVGAVVTFTASSTDPDGTSVVYSLVGAPAGATMGSTTGAFSWNTTGAAVGAHVFEVVASDGVLSASTTVTITVNVAPVPATPAPTVSSGGGGGGGTVSGPLSFGFQTPTTVPPAPEVPTQSANINNNTTSPSIETGTPEQTPQTTGNQGGNTQTGGQANRGQVGNSNQSLAAGVALSDNGDIVNQEESSIVTGNNSQVAAAVGTGFVTSKWFWLLILVLLAAGGGWYWWNKKHKA